jgi:hypothetical protein
LRIFRWLLPRDIVLGSLPDMAAVPADVTSLWWRTSVKGLVSSLEEQVDEDTKTENRHMPQWQCDKYVYD